MARDPRTAHDARTNPQPGDKSFRRNPPGPEHPFATHATEVVSVGIGKPSILTVDTTRGDGSVARERLALDVWSDDYDGAWVYVPRADVRDPRTNPQPGDVMRATPKHGDGPDCVWTVLERMAPDEVRILCPDSDGETRRSVAWWGRLGSGCTWTWTRAEDVVADAPAEAPAPKAWYEARGLPGCLAALPTPADGALEALDLWRDLEALGYVPTGADDSGRVSVAPDNATVYRRGDGKYAAMWSEGHVFPEGGLAATMAAYVRARTAPPAPAPRDPRTDPRPGDTKTWHGDPHPGYFRTHTVEYVVRDRVHVVSRTLDGRSTLRDMTLYGWADDVGGLWTFTPGV